jgi:hypothetical protein
MKIRSRGRRFEIDTDAGLFVRCPLLGEVFCARGHSVEWTPAHEVRRLREKQAAQFRKRLALLDGPPADYRKEATN